MNTGNTGNSSIDSIYRPFLFRLSDPHDKLKYKQIVAEVANLLIRDTIYVQLKEYVKLKNPSKNLSEADCRGLVSEELNGREPEEYGVWAFYPWSGRMVHLLDEQKFIEVRTNRNLYKITREERDILAGKKIGIIGLSVGQSIALTLAMERGFGELRLADFDQLDLSNMNRIRTGVHNIGLKKVHITAREIAEIDPFLKVTCFEEGLTMDNLDDFMLGNGRLDLVFEECDGLDMKILSRYKARELGIPLVMDTSDRGMLDVERYDLNPSMPLLHGLLGDIDPGKLSSLSNEDKIPVVLRMAGIHDISARGRASMIEVGQSISTWPQLASSVVLGGAVSADVSRRLLLGQFKSSGRYYVDLEQLIADEKHHSGDAEPRANPYQPLTDLEMEGMISKAVPHTYTTVNLQDEKLYKLVKAGTLAPSTGNDQPWRFYYRDGVLYLFHERYRSFSFGNYGNIASFLTFGAVYENMLQEAAAQSLHMDAELFPLGEDSPLVAKFYFKDDNKAQKAFTDLAPYIPSRCTNRNSSPRQEIAEPVLGRLKEATESIPGAVLQFLTDPADISRISRVIGACDRMRLLNREGHYDFVNREMRWKSSEAEKTKDGIDVLTLGLSSSQLSALEVIKDYNVISMVKKVGGGKLFEAAAMRSLAPASAIGFIYVAGDTAHSYIEGGRALERMWLEAEKQGLAVHPVISPLYFFPRIMKGKGESLSQENIAELWQLRKEFEQLFRVPGKAAEVFLFKLAYAARPELRSWRLPVGEVLTIK